MHGMTLCEKIVWIAGLIEGEGTFYLNKGRYPVVAVIMTDEDIIKRCKEFTGIGSVRGPYLPYNSKKPLWSWKVSGRKAAALMMTILPLMGEKRQTKIKECLEVWKTVREWGHKGCNIAGCVQPHLSKGLCSKHYQRIYK
jgi:hypothetical protein